MKGSKKQTTDESENLRHSEVVDAALAVVPLAERFPAVLGDDGGHGRSRHDDPGGFLRVGRVGHGYMRAGPDAPAQEVGEGRQSRGAPRAPLLFVALVGSLQ